MNNDGTTFRKNLTVDGDITTKGYIKLGNSIVANDYAYIQLKGTAKMDMLIKVSMLVAFFAVMLGVGFYCRKNATDVNGFVLGGRSVGPWLTAFAFGTSYFSAVVFVGYAGQHGWNIGIGFELLEIGGEEDHV